MLIAAALPCEGRAVRRGELSARLRRRKRLLHARAAVAGFRNVLCPNACVAHEGGVSFSEATQALMKAGAERLLAKHPSYDAEVAHGSPPIPAHSRRTQVSAILAQR